MILDKKPLDVQEGFGRGGRIRTSAAFRFSIGTHKRVYFEISSRILILLFQFLIFAQKIAFVLSNQLEINNLQSLALEVKPLCELKWRRNLSHNSTNVKLVNGF
jgi:hypothetical protein